MNKKAVSGLVATVLLIAAAISTGLIIASFTRTSAEKVVGHVKMMSNQVECSDIQLSIDNFDNTGLTLKNRGTLGISDIVFRDYSGTTKYTKDFTWKKEDDTPFSWQTEKKLMPGVKIKTPELTTAGISKLDIIPILIIEGENIGCENAIKSWEKE